VFGSSSHLCARGSPVVRGCPGVFVYVDCPTVRERLRSQLVAQTPVTKETCSKEKNPVAGHRQLD
jgi:hypothetical protein